MAGDEGHRRRHEHEDRPPSEDLRAAFTKRAEREGGEEHGGQPRLDEVVLRRARLGGGDEGAEVEQPVEREGPVAAAEERVGAGPQSKQDDAEQGSGGDQERSISLAERGQAVVGGGGIGDEVRPRLPAGGQDEDEEHGGRGQDERQEEARDEPPGGRLGQERQQRRRGGHERRLLREGAEDEAGARRPPPPAAPVPSGREEPEAGCGEEAREHVHPAERRPRDHEPRRDEQEGGAEGERAVAPSLPHDSVDDHHQRGRREERERPRGGERRAEEPVGHGAQDEEHGRVIAVDHRVLADRTEVASVLGEEPGEREHDALAVVPAVRRAQIGEAVEDEPPDPGREKRQASPEGQPWPERALDHAQTLSRRSLACPGGPAELGSGFRRRPDGRARHEERGNR